MRYSIDYLGFSTPTADSVARVLVARGEGHRLSKRTSQRSSGRKGICIVDILGCQRADVLVCGCPEYSKPGKLRQDCHSCSTFFWRNELWQRKLQRRLRRRLQLQSQLLRRLQRRLPRRSSLRTLFGNLPAAGSLLSAVFHALPTTAAQSLTTQKTQQKSHFPADHRCQSGAPDSDGP